MDVQSHRNPFLRPRNMERAFSAALPGCARHTFLPPLIWPVPPARHNAAYRADLQQRKNETVTPSVPVPFPPVVWYNPLLPSIVLFAKTGVLAPPDMLYCMSQFFGAGLVDRRLTWQTPVPTRVLDPMPAFDPGFSKPLPKVCDGRAREILARADALDVDVHVLWSGGMNSTAVLVALLRVATPAQRKRLVIDYSDTSSSEYELFFCDYVRMLRRRKITHLGQALEAGTGGEHLLVTGELGDQIFGSVLMAVVTPSASPKKETALMGIGGEPWADTLPYAMEAIGAIPHGTADEWLQFVKPQVAKSPVRLVTVFDFLWWINLSCVWQADSLRLLCMQTTLKPTTKMMDRIVHFYRSDEFQQWSFHNHGSKMPNLSDWLSFKKPLKAYIFEFTNDKIYRDAKQKKISFLQLINHFGEVRDYDPNRWIALSDAFDPIFFGKHSICLDILKQKIDISSVPISAAAGSSVSGDGGRDGDVQTLWFDAWKREGIMRGGNTPWFWSAVSLAVQSQLENSFQKSYKYTNMYHSGFSGGSTGGF